MKKASLLFFFIIAILNLCYAANVGYVKTITKNQSCTDRIYISFQRTTGETDNFVINDTDRSTLANLMMAFQNHYQVSYDPNPSTWEACNGDGNFSGFRAKSFSFTNNP